MRRSLLFSLLLAVLTIERLLGAEHTTGAFHGCPPEGRQKSSHGFYDPVLDGLKNRDVPPGSYVDRSLAAVIKHNPAALVADGAHMRAKWSADALQDAASWEDHGARVEGRLIAITTSGPESCNCGGGKSGNDVDQHVWIATQASHAAKADRSMIVEISPRTPTLKALHDQLVTLAHTGTRLRVSGWMLWDQEHGSLVGKSRGTLWEIHPVHKIEAWQHGAWVTLGAE